MKAILIADTNRPCTNCDFPATRKGVAFMHTTDDDQFVAIYCKAPECFDAETYAWQEGTQ